MFDDEVALQKATNDVVRLAHQRDESCVLFIEACLDLGHVRPQSFDNLFDTLDIAHVRPLQANAKAERTRPASKRGARRSVLSRLLAARDYDGLLDATSVG
jgi:hypothetical protein